MSLLNKIISLIYYKFNNKNKLSSNKRIFSIVKDTYLNLIKNVSRTLLYLVVSFDVNWSIVKPTIKSNKDYNKEEGDLYLKRISLIIAGWNIQFIIFIKHINIFFFNFKSIAIKLIYIILFNIKWIILSLIISFLYFFISLFYIQIDIAKQIALWYILFIIYYLLLSTFNSFLNKYRYGKFTSAIQRFWKRTGMVFWLIEGFLFLLFFYYFLNSSQEPIYMFDYSNLNQELLIQLKSSYKNMILLSLAIYLSFILIININFLVYYQTIILLLLISIIIFYMLYIESYQFVYILNIFSDNEWNFEESTQIWNLEVEQNNLRVKQQYFILCLIAKYWHFIFIFISWFFFLIKSIEIEKINITLLGYNTQNLLILYILNLLCIIQWFKYIFKKFFEITYYWFHMQYDEKFLVSFILEIWATFKSYFNFNNINIVNIKVLTFSNKIFYSNDLLVWKYL